MLTEIQKNNPFYMMDRTEFKKLAIRLVGGELINISGSRDIFGYNDEFNTFIVAKKSYDLGTNDYHKSLSRMLEKKNTEHILVIGFSFNGKFIQHVKDDPQMRVIHVTVEDMFKNDYESALPKIIEDMIKKYKPLSSVFKSMK